jgi:hypothetical protein
MGIYIITLATLISLFHFPARAEMSAEEKGYKISEMCAKTAAGFGGEEAVVDMEIITAGGDRLNREINFKTKERSGGDRLLLTVLNPPDIRGTKLLTWAHPDRDDEQWLYLPSMKRVKRISAQLKSGSFMGSEFAYEDFSKKEVAKYNYRFLRNEVLKGRKTWVIERVAKEPGSGYSREILWYDWEYKAALKNEFYDRKKDLFKTAEIEGYRKMENRWWRPSKITMSNVQTKNKSVLTYKKLKLKVNLSEGLFNSENLKE